MMRTESKKIKDAKGKQAMQGYDNEPMAMAKRRVS
jgi:hypothetical protein